MSTYSWWNSNIKIKNQKALKEVFEILSRWYGDGMLFKDLYDVYGIEAERFEYIINEKGVFSEKEITEISNTVFDISTLTPQSECARRAHAMVREIHAVSGVTGAFWGYSDDGCFEGTMIAADGTKTEVDLNKWSSEKHGIETVEESFDNQEEQDAWEEYRDRVVELWESHCESLL